MDKRSLLCYNEGGDEYDERRNRKKQLSKIAAGFGSGMAGLRETCGTVTGANMVIGLAKGKNRMEANRTFREFADRFREKNGSLVCKELLAARIKTRLTCADLCYDAGNLLEEILAK